MQSTGIPDVHVRCTQTNADIYIILMCPGFTTAGTEAARGRPGDNLDWQRPWRGEQPDQRVRGCRALLYQSPRSPAPSVAPAQQKLSCLSIYSRPQLYANLKSPPAFQRRLNTFPLSV